MKKTTPLILPLLVFVFSHVSSDAAEEIGFIEKFALAEDREDALKQLIPGTPDYYYYHALHSQNQGKLDEVDAFLEPWVKRHGETAKVWEIRNRQALLRYDKNPNGSMEYLRRRMGLQFNHQQQKLDAKPNLPTRLDPAQVSWEAFLREAFRSSKTLNQISDAGLDAVIRRNVKLDDRRRRELLSRLKYPDYDRLVGMIAADLRTKESRGFGEFPIHANLLPEQLDELLRLDPTLINNTKFVYANVKKLHPSADVDWRHDTAEREAYLNRMWDYIKTLPPSFNSLKAHSLYQLLLHYQKKGEYPRDLFTEYLKLPRFLPYVSPEYLKDTNRRRYQVDLNADFLSITSCVAIRSDEALVRDYLLHFFVEAPSWEPFAPLIRETYLKPIFAEAKLISGVGDAEKWYSLLNPAALQKLKERVDIAFPLTNPEHFSAADEVTLEVMVKNVDQLMVKVYEINALNYFLSEKRDLNTDLNLDGLIANEEKTYAYQEGPIRQVKRSFSFDSMKGKRGIWVVEFIGNGMSSRALVRKGKLQYLSQTTAAGAIITVLDEENKKAKDPAVWFGGKRYEPNKKGIILLPFSSEGGDHPVVLTDGDFSSFEEIKLPEEDYFLSARFLIDRETLLSGTEATVAVRPNFTIGSDIPVSVSLLEEIKLTITTVDLDGIVSVNEIPDFTLFDDRESTYTFRVPSRLRNINFSLSAKVTVVSWGGEKDELEDSNEIKLNATDESPQVVAIHLSQVGGNYIAEIFGKTGEPIPNRAIHFEVHHRDFNEALRYSLRTDEDGRTLLGRLNGIDLLTLKSDGLQPREWILSGDTHTSHDINAKVGDVVNIPIMLANGKLQPEDLAIFEKRRGTFVKNVFAQCKYERGQIQVEGLSAGNYRVHLRNANEYIDLTITQATNSVADYALSKSRHLQIQNPQPLQIASVSQDNEAVTIQLTNSDKFTRVHLAATRFLPEFELFSNLEQREIESSIISRGNSESLYVSGRDIGDEYRYILERRAAKKFPGNMLKRPAVILNPWALQKTETSVDNAKKGDQYKRSKESKKSMRSKAKKESEDPQYITGPTDDSTNLDFLAKQAVTFYNLTPDKNGKITIKTADLGDRQHIHVLAVNRNNTAYRQISLEEKGRETQFRDLRLQQHLDLKKHFTQQRNATLLNAGESLSIADLRASELETYDTLSSVFTTLSGVRSDETFSQFSFILTWPELDDAKKRELYSKYASHELNFFLSRHDPDFFAQVIQPYLRNKRDKTFFDDYLVENNLAEYTQPWKYGRLNIAERILLARRLGNQEPGITARHVKDLFDLIPLDVAQESYFFRSALRGRRSSGGSDTTAGFMALSAPAEPDPFGGGNAEMAGGSRKAIHKPQLRALKKSMPAAASFIPRSPATPVVSEEAESAKDIAADKKPDTFAIAGVMLDTAADIQELRKQAEAQSLFRKLEATQEWAENNYYHRPIAEQIDSLITVNAFWKDFAAWDGKGDFYSRHFPAASNSFAEMMLALAVLDLPFTAEKHDFKIEDNSLTLTAKSPLIVFHEEIKEAEEAKDKAPILISQNFFRNDDRYAHINNEQVDKFVTDEFLTGVLYGCQVVVTNPTSSSHKLDLLLQIPQGAIPANRSDYTKTEHVHLTPFSTKKVETYFYFPDASGDEVFGHYPVQVAKDEKLIAWADPFDFKVVNKLSKIDKASWEYLSQFGTGKEVLDYLNNHNIQRINLSRIAWRMREKPDFFRSTLALLEKRHRYDATLWSYGIYHNDTKSARDFLTHREDFLSQCGKWIDCELVSIDPVERHWYQHLEYSPLVNARAHRLGRDSKILNKPFRSQYQGMLKVLSYRPQFDDNDHLTAAFYLFLQDRVEEALARLAKVQNPEAVETRLQLDYLNAYASLYQGEPKKAAAIAANYVAYPVDHWQARFAQVSEQVKEIAGAEGQMTDDEDRDQQQEKLSANSPALELKTEGRAASLLYRNLKTVTVNYYEMDLEFLFSSKPFVSGDSGQFSFIKPNLSERKDLPAGKDVFEFQIPDRFASKNVLVEVVGGGQSKSSAVYANSLKVQISENYGQVQVRSEKNDKPQSKVYVKVYAEHKDGSVKFFKDGYTDLRGKFDYISLNTNELDNVKKLSLLIMSEGAGSLVREVKPPQR